MLHVINRLTSTMLLGFAVTMLAAPASAASFKLRVFSKGVVAAPASPPTSPEATGPAPQQPAPLAAAWTVTGSGSFSSVKVGTASTPLTLTVKNSGNGSGTPSVSAFYNGQPSDFSIASNSCAGAIPAGGSCAVSVSFTPSAVGSRFTDLKIAETAVRLNGEGFAPDPHSAQVSLSLAMAAPDGTTTFTDANGVAVTSVGAVHRTAFADGGTAGYFNGASRSHLLTGNSSAFGFGTGDFTMESWVNYSTGGCIVSLRSDGTQVFYNNVMQIQGGRLEWSDGFTWHTGSTVIPANTWTHVAVTRASGIVRFFVNGVLNGQVSQPMDLGSSRVARIGVLENDIIPYTGYMADLRITKGVARYTTNFTPPSL